MKVEAICICLCVAKGTKNDEFLKDVVVAFASRNIPLEKLKVSGNGGNEPMSS